MAIPVITALPPVPQRTDLPAEFSIKADQFVAALVPFRNELNSMANWFGFEANRVLQIETTVELFADNAEQSALEASNYAGTASQYRDTAQGYMNTTEGYMNTTEGYMNTTVSYRDQTAQYVITGRAWTDTTTSVNKTLTLFERCSVGVEGLTITLPSSPTNGYEVIISVGDFKDTIIDGNGESIVGNVDQALVNKKYATVHLFYNGTEWRFS